MCDVSGTYKVQFTYFEGIQQNRCDTEYKIQLPQTHDTA